MTTLSLGEPIARGVLAYVDANAGDKLTAVAARFTPAIPLPMFRALRMSDPAFEVEDVFPVLYCVAESDVLQLGPVGLTGGWWLNTELSLWIAYELTVDRTGVGITEAETMRAMGARYAVALLELLTEGIADMGFEPGTGTLQPQIAYGPTITNRERTTWLSSVLVRIGVQTWETGS